MVKIIVGIIIFVLGFAGANLLEKSVQPLVKRDANIATVNGGDADLVVSQQIQSVNTVPSKICKGIGVLGFGLSLFGFYGYIKRRNKKSAVTTTAVLLLFSAFLLSGCRKPYDVPEYKEISNSQSAYVIPLEGDTKNKQVKFDSVSYLESKKVGVKRIQVTHRWNQTGRYSWQGSWIPDVNIIVFDRSPVTVEMEAIEPWKNKNNTKDNSIWTESSDSIGFSLGWTVTGFVNETNSSTFLYWYPNGTLKEVLTREVKGRIQEISSLVAAKYPIDILRTNKVEIYDSVKKDIIPFFESRGITITTVGMFGGMVYDNEKIQNAIDETFIAQQEKVVSAAQLAAQADKNKRIEAEADAKAKAAEKEAQGIANGNLLKAKAEAEGIDAINKAIERAQSNLSLLELKRLEIEKIKYEKWSGKYPDTVVGSGANVWVGLDGEKKLPAVEQSKK